MLDDMLWNSGSWLPNTLAGAPVLRGDYHHSGPQTASIDHTGESTVITASVEERVSDLIRSYPRLKVFLKSRPKDPNARIRDLTISTRERNQLLYQIIAARRQELLTSGRAEPRLLSAPWLRMRLAPTDPVARDWDNDWPKDLSR
jgi:hypothetical protein